MRAFTKDIINNMKFTQCIPYFCEGFTPIEITFNNLEELYNNKHLLKWKDENFEQFYVLNDKTVMVKYKEGSSPSKWCLGYISSEESENGKL